MTNIVVITPARDEEQNIGSTIVSVVKQTIKPTLWIIVNDSSADKTAEIVSGYGREYPWIKLIDHPAIGERRPGTRVVEAFRYGEKFLPDVYDFIVKLDADVTMDVDYFQRLLGEFENDPRLGIAGGYCAISINGMTVFDETPAYHVRGATKIYRRQCYQQIGGLLPVMGWDTLDEMKAMMLGWKTKSFKEAVLTHPRPTGSATGLTRYAWMAGKSFWFMGYDPIYLLLSSMKRVFRRPYLLFGMTIILGYLSGLISKAPIIDDKDLVRFIRKFQRNRLKGMYPEEWLAREPVGTALGG